MTAKKPKSLAAPWAERASHRREVGIPGARGLNIVVWDDETYELEVGDVDPDRLTLNQLEDVANALLSWISLRRER